MAKFQSKYGHFTDDGREYVIENPRTPKPWCNVISNGDYSMMVSQTGGGYSWRGNAGQNRITRAFQDLIKDNWGKYVYIRDVDSGKLWSAAWKPIEAEYDSYNVRQGIGYTIFEQIAHGIKSEMCVFIAPDAPVEYISLKLTNLGADTRKLDITTYFEWILGFAPDEHREFHKLFIETKQKDNAVYADKCLWSFADEKGRHNNVSWPYTAFHACSLPLKSFTCDKESFVGMYGSEKEPLGLSQAKLDNSFGRFGDACASLQTELTLAANECKTVVFTIGAAEHGMEDADELIAAHTSPEACAAQFAKVGEFWSKLIDAERVQTPDDALNFMTNTWLKYQAISGRLWGKSAYYQVSAGYGYRDQLQDCQIFLECAPELAKKQLLMHAAQQFAEGDVYHWWFTIRGGGPRTKCSDDLLWLPFILDSYLIETGDYAILDEIVPYANGGEGDIYDHCKRAIERTFTRFSPRGIPLMGDHDWNDGLSAIGNEWRGESFWVAEFLYMTLEGFIPLAERRGDKAFAEKCRVVMANMKEAMNKHGWDGEWYLQATTDDGEKVGSAENEEGKIFLNPQIWAVMSGIAEGERAKQCMDSVTKHLLRDYGTILLYPAYTKVRTDIGYITRYTPGLRENGGVYTHAATWSIWAYALMGDAENAYKAFTRICPPNRSSDIDKYFAEPYVTPGNTDGPVSPLYGRGGWTWYTGSAQWLHRMATHWILGIRPTHDGLLIDPLIPKDWDGFTVTRNFRGGKFNIKVENPNKVSRGVKEVYIDGNLASGNLIPIISGEHEIKVILG